MAEGCRSPALASIRLEQTMEVDDVLANKMVELGVTPGCQ